MTDVQVENSPQTCTKVNVPGKKKAFVCGIIEYSNVPNLRTATNDAEDIAKRLKESDELGFEVTKVADNHCERTTLIQKYNMFLEKVKAGDFVFIYFAGHGLVRKDDKELHILPSDAEIQRENGIVNGINFSADILEPAVKKNMKMLTIILDICRDEHNDAERNTREPPRKKRSMSNLDYTILLEIRFVSNFFSGHFFIPVVP